MFYFLFFSNSQLSPSIISCLQENRKKNAEKKKQKQIFEEKYFRNKKKEKKIVSVWFTVEMSLILRFEKFLIIFEESQERVSKDMFEV